LEQLYKWTKPGAIVPMHGEARHLEAHAEFASSSGIKQVVSARNGSVVRLCPGPSQTIDDVPAGRIYMDGRLPVLAGEGPVEDRRRLSFSGAVALSIVMTHKGDVLADPQITAIGLPAETENGIPFSEIILNAAVGALEGIPHPRRRDSALVAEAVRKAVRAEVNGHWGKKPPCSVMVSVI
jgi:ribonuclease J